MNSETRNCQNCKQAFAIEPDDFAFYEKIKVPPPTWCPECRMIRRFAFRNETHLFRRKDAHDGKEIFSSFPAAAPVVAYETDYWFSDGWDPMGYGKDPDFSRPFLEQFRDLMQAVPLYAKSVQEMVNSDYCDQAGWLKNCYLCFNAGELENSAYIRSGWGSKDGFDLYESRHSELSYNNYMVDESFRVFFSVNVEDSTDIWFSRNLTGCNNCFGCINLRNKSYCVFNEQYTKEAYKEFVDKFRSGSHAVMSAMQDKAVSFWKKHPLRFTLAIACVNSIGEHIERSKNLKYCYTAHESENLAFTQMVEPTCTDSYDYTNFGWGADRMYEALTSGNEAANVRFAWECWNSVSDIDYSSFCVSSSNLFGCVGLHKKQYCILNKQYTKEEYFKLREKIIAHMNEMPYTDKLGRTYRYGEFFPPEFSPFAYNETIAQDFFPLTKAEAEKRGYLWREPERREYKATMKAAELPDDIADVQDDILKAIIACGDCEQPYRIIPMELQFYRRIPLPLPRKCPECRFKDRFKFVNPPKFWPAKCQCAGKTDDSKLYTNQNGGHAHGAEHCPNTFETSYAPERQEIIYCEQCYNAEAS
jgi:hypothetical protein